MTTYICVNFVPGNGLLPGGTKHKPLPEPMLISHQCGSVAFIFGQLHSEFPSYNEFGNDILEITATISVLRKIFMCNQAHHNVCLQRMINIDICNI